MTDAQTTGRGDTETEDRRVAAPRGARVASAMPSDPSKTRRVELILRQIDSLPTLPAIATRLLSLTTSEDSTAREVIELVASDQALSSKVLALCRRADRGVRDEIMTVDKAVVLLGFNAIRNAVLSIKVFEVFEEKEPRGQGVQGSGDEEDETSSTRSNGSSAPQSLVFDRVNFWRHSLAVAVAAELIAAAHGNQPDIQQDEAFICGLLHDMGKLALDYVLPKSFARVIELADLNQGNIAEFERRIVGIDHHTAGKRLAEQWQLPHRIQDCIWLHGSAFDTLPRLEHRRLIGLVGLADLVVRQHHVGYSGNYTFKQDPARLARSLDLDPAKIDSIIDKLHEEVQRRAQILGLDDRPSRDLFLHSIQQANQVLGRLNDALDRRGQTAARQAQVLDAVTAFHAGAVPGRSVQDVLDAVVANASMALGPGFYGILQQVDAAEAMDDENVISGGGGEGGWLIGQYNESARPVRKQIVAPPPHAPDLSRLESNQSLSLDLMGILPWLADFLVESQDLRKVRLLPLTCGWGTSAVLLHDRSVLPPAPQLAALASTWGAAIAAAGQHDGARRLGEQLAEANLALAEAQDRLLQTESMARLGEMAAGAAHEMNNPLAVIAGRSQLLTMSLQPGCKEQKAAQTIFEQSNRLSDLITALRSFADPPKPTRRPTDVGPLLSQTITAARQGLSEEQARIPVYLQIKSELPVISLDPEQIGQALVELLNNAIQAVPRSAVYVSARVEPIEKNLVIQVSDDGIGMDAHTLSHAMDPFFSAKAAGRRVGMGLPRAQQLAVAHGGRVELRSTPGNGTVASLLIPLDSTG